MRMRAKKNLPQRMENCAAIHITEPENAKQNWTGIFGNTNPLHLEIGCGKGTFVTEMARRYPNINFVAMEKDRNVIISAMERTVAEEIPNIRFICDNADILDAYFETNSCQRIYLNFSDPLPKQGYRKRRLTHERYLSVYQRILTPEGEIHQKTDNKAFFEFSMDSVLTFGFSLKKVYLDLHSSAGEENVVTEYEAKFSSMGMPIYKLEAGNIKDIKKE